MKPFFVMALIVAAPLSAQVTFNPVPSREFGQHLLPLPGNPPTSSAPNLIEGRELNGPASIAFDYSVTPPTVYIADVGNNRVLGWKNSTTLSQGNFADIVAGQLDAYSNVPGGPGTAASTGMYLPVAVAVDTQGNLYVADAGNNRILRFPKGLSTGSFPNLVIGQASFSSGGFANQGQAAPTSKTLFLSTGGVYYQTGMAFDSQGNLWVTDGGNNRVLRYPAASLAAGTQQMAADTVLGQTSFVSNQPPQPPSNTNVQVYLSGLYQPNSLTFDTAGRLYVADFYARVLEFQPNPASVGQPADRVLGVAPTPSQGGCPAYPTSSTLGLLNSSCSFAGAPAGVFALGTSLFVCDTPNNRVVWYGDYSTWGAATSTAPSPAQIGVLGQPNPTSRTANAGSLVATVANQSGLSGPVAGAVNTANNELWIVDSGNNRVMVFPSQANLVYTLPASRVLGQLGYSYNSPNLIDGQEVWFLTNLATAPNQVLGGGGLVVDKNSTPPHLYIADTANNRILGFNDARAVGTDAHNALSQVADLVIGQPNLSSALANYSTNPTASGDPTQPGSTGLYRPVGLAVDSHGNLYVADAGNGRVLRFPSPFSQQPGALQTANLVLGQSSFTGPTIKDPSQSTMNTPFGLALFYDSTLTVVTGLAVSDAVHNRIVVFSVPTGGDFSSGMLASGLIGQANYTSIQTGTSTSNLNSPRHIAVDSSNRLFVADSQNDRLLAFTAGARLAVGAAAVLQVQNLNQPQGVAVSLITGESWVTSTNSNIIYRLPEFDTLQANQEFTEELGSNGPLAVALDSFDNLVVAEGINRVSFYFPEMYYRHAASYAAGINSTGNPTPGMLALVARYGTNFSLTAAPVQSLPWQTTLNDVQVIINGVAAPVWEMSSAVIYIQIPMATPDSGDVDWVAQLKSTGQILAAGTFTMQQASPGLFTLNQEGTQQIAATNYNSSGAYTGINGPANPLPIEGGVITLWLTGQGKVNPPPPDGVAPGTIIYTATVPTVYIGGLQATVISSVLSPQFPGLWQIDVEPNPMVLAGNTNLVLVLMDDYASTVAGNPTLVNGGPAPDITLTPGNGLITTMATK
jgi:uncharacterized protein (TIGR03437 family)